MCKVTTEFRIYAFSYVCVSGGGIRIMCQISLFDISMSKYLRTYVYALQDV